MGLITELLIGGLVGKPAHSMKKNETGSLPNVIKIIENKNGRRIIMIGVRKDFPPKNFKRIKQKI